MMVMNILKHVALEGQEIYYVFAKSVRLSTIFCDHVVNDDKVATKKKNIADEVGVILQAKLKQLAPTP
ncbi:hypothetical protein CsSME_00042605 [Camellia sinensis var. sinensis]